MAQLGRAFNRDEVPEGEPTDLLPNGTYTAQIIESSVVDTKSGQGQLVNLTWEIMDGPHERRRVWTRINYLHSNPVAQDIGQRELRKITDAMGINVFNDTDDLHFKPVLITVGVEKSKDANYPDKNKVTGAKPIGGAAQARTSPPASPPPAPASTARPAASTGAQRPWDRPRT